MNKKSIVILCSVATILLIFVIILYSSRYKKQVYVENNNEQIKTGTKVSLMIETKADSGDYKLSTSSEWPTSGYIFNAERSMCENGGTLSWNKDTNSVVLNTRVSDKCYVYFDVQSPDVSITATNLQKLMVNLVH